VGSTTLTRTQVRAISRSSPDESRAIQAGWRKSYYLHEKYVPSGLEDLAAGFLRLSEQRDAARAARRLIGGAHSEETRLDGESGQLQRMLAETSARLQAATPSNGVAAYNALVATNNILQSRLTLARNALEQLRKSCAAAVEQVLAYQEALVVFGRLLANVPPPLPKDAPAAEARRYFLGRISDSVRAFEGEFVTSSAEGEPSRSGTIVTVRINGAVDGKFILDTGASMVTLTEAFARRVPIDTTLLPSGQFTVADGRKVSGRLATLDSVKLGDAQVEGVEAVIFSTPSDYGADGLLGMSFLKYFAVHLEGGSGKVILRRFDPQ
jgi:clan AA aspartic protease (TIGR02281 family)